MRILAVGDVPSAYYYEHYRPRVLEPFDLILASGDLPRDYLEFIVTLARCPVVYVRGNHDDGYAKAPPAGCICAEGRIVNCQGLRILGLGGSSRYRKGENMYTEGQMRRRIWRLWPQLLRNRGFDILLTHSPARGINDLDTPAHRGFECFVNLLERYRPAYFVHGHVHRNYGMDIPQYTVRGNTRIINAYDHCVFDYEKGICHDGR